MREALGHLWFDTVSLQLIGLVFFGWWLGLIGCFPGDGREPVSLLRLGAQRALASFLVLALTLAYYGRLTFPAAGQMGLWASQVGILTVIRMALTRGRSIEVWKFWELALIFWAVASLAVVFLG